MARLLFKSFFEQQSGMHTILNSDSYLTLHQWLVLFRATHFFNLKILLAQHREGKGSEQAWRELLKGSPKAPDKVAETNDNKCNEYACD